MSGTATVHSFVQQMKGYDEAQLCCTINIMTMLKRDSGSALHITIIIILVIAILGLLGYVLWSNFFRTSSTETLTTSQTEPFCSAEETETADNGTFCSADMGIKFDVPRIFKGIVAEADNYEVFSSTVDPDSKVSAGNSEMVFEATISGTDNFTLTIAKEPLRTGYVGLPHLVYEAYFDQASGVLSSITFPEYNYDSTTGATTTTGDYAVGDPASSFMVGDIKVFKGLFGDAGTSIITYFAVVNDKIIKIGITHGGYIGDPADDPSTIDGTEVLDEFEAGIKTLVVS
jgi:hypothetical protein